MLKDKVAASIRALYPDVDTDNLIESGGRVTGYLVAPSFEGIVEGNGIDEIWDRLRSDLGKDAAKVGFLLFLSPRAVEAYAAYGGAQV